MKKTSLLLLLLLSFCVLMLSGCGEETVYQTNVYDNLGDATDIVIDVAESNVNIAFSDDKNMKVECKESNKIKHSVEVKNDVLTIKDTRKCYEHVGVEKEEIAVNVHLSKESYGKLSIENSSGKIEVASGFTFTEAELSNSSGEIRFSAKVANDLEANTSSGKITLSNMTCQSANIETSSGDIEASALIASGNMYLEASSGKITLAECDASALDISTSSGDIKGTLLSKKTFDAKSSSGKVKVPYPSEGGLCKIRSSSGDIDILTANK